MLDLWIPDGINCSREVGEGEGKEGTVPSGHVRMRTDIASEKEEGAQEKNVFYISCVGPMSHCVHVLRH